MKTKLINKNIKFLLIGIVLLILILFILLSLYLLIPPKIILNGEETLVMEYPNEYIEPGYSARFLWENLSKKVEIKSFVDSNKLGTYEIQYSVKNKLGIFKSVKTRKIKIVDNESPQISLTKSDIILPLGEKYIEPGYSAIDNYDGDITNNVKVESNVDSTHIGEYKVIYKVKDSSNNETEVERNVEVYKNNVNSVPILTYHGFMTSEEKKKYALDEQYTISTDAFEEQLKYLKDNGYKTITLDEFYEWYTNQRTLTNKDVVIVIDDGNISQYYHAIPLLNKYEFSATIFVITGRIKDYDAKWDPTKIQFFSNDIIEDIKTNYKNISLESHTNNLHQLIDNQAAIKVKSNSEIEEDLKISKEILSAEYLAFPYGWNTPSSSEILKKLGYKMAFAFGYGNYGRATKNDDQYYIKRVNIKAETSMNEFINWLEVE